MTTNIPYGEASIDVTVPDRNFGGVIELSDQTYISDVCSSIRQALVKDAFERFLGNASRVLLVANDSYRSTPSSLAFDALQPYLRDIPDLRVVIATGLHRKPSDNEIKQILGEDLAKSHSRVAHSDAFDRSQFDSFGEWENGSEILIHKLVSWAEKIIVIGSVEPHYFAGFTGGPKSFLPGLSHHSTIQVNHALAIDTECQPAKLEGNPVAESIREAVSRLDYNNVYSIQFVNDSRQNVIGIFAGALWDSFDKAVQCAQDVYVRPVRKKHHVVVAVNCHPLDRNLYQLQKSFENSRSIVEDGGSIIVVSACREGVGNDEFIAIADKYPEPEDILSAKQNTHSLGYHKLYRTALHTRKIDIFVKSELSDRIVRRVYLDPVHDIQQKIDQAIAKFGEKAGVIIVMDAGHIVPYVDRAA
jgi:nickel-dependent lactate racemase